jgi:hypothetical protein
METVMKTPIDPLKQERRRYEALRAEANEYARNVYNVLVTPKTMFRYPQEKMNLNWNLQDLLERTKAAQQLGYRVVITADEEGILVQYEKQLSKNLKFF